MADTSDMRTDAQKEEDAGEQHKPTDAPHTPDEAPKQAGEAMDDAKAV